MSQADDVVYCPLSFCYTNYAREGYAPRLIRFANIPGKQGALLGGAGYAVSATCPHPTEACAYGVWLCSAEIQRTFYVAHGGQPGNRIAWIDDEANRITHGFFRDTGETIEHAYVRPRHNGFPVFQEAAGNLIHAMLRDQGDLDRCLDQLFALYRQNLPPDASQAT
jgi:multiple sugar transport system substrate-binding protein